MNKLLSIRLLRFARNDRWQQGFIRLTKKTLVLTLMAWVILVSSGLMYMFKFSKRVEAAWYDDNWSYRTSLIVTNNAADSNKKVKFDIDTATLITAGKMQSDCGDSRFTDVNGNLLRYFIDTSGGDCNTNSTDYYVLVPTIINGTTVIYHYYGNPSVANGAESANFSEDTLTPSGGSAAGSEEKAKSPIAYWSFDDGQGTTAQDATTNNLDGTLNNTPAWQTEDMCIAGKCLYFDGTNNENVSKADDSKLDFAASDNFTIGAWVKRNGTSSANNFILTKAQTGYTGYKLYQDASGDYCFDVSDGTNTDTACTSAVDFDDNNWHLVQGVKSGTTSITLYVDGKQRAQDASIAATGTLANTGTFYIGVDLDGTSNEWLGFIDEVKIYPYARTASQIQADYNARGTSEGASAVIASGAKQSLSNGLVGYWKMDESSWTNDCSATSVTDSSGNGNNGKSCPASTGPTSTTTGKFGNGGSFDGSDDRITVSVTPGSKLSISAWVKSTYNSGYQNITHGNGMSQYLSIYQGNFRVYDGVAWRTVTTTISSGALAFVTMTYNSDNNKELKLYVNGNLEYSGSGLSTYTTSSISTIGHDTADVRPFNGMIDDLRIYNRALSPNEVSQLYNFAPGPVGYWKFDENTGTSANDSSGNARTGTINGNPVWAPGKFGKGIKMDGTGDNVQISDF